MTRVALPPAARALLETAAVAHVVTLNRDGSPQVTAAWVGLDGDTATIGITFHAQKELGDIVFVDLPKVGATVEKGKALGSVESVKAVSDLYAPASGVVTEVNGDLSTHPEKVNSDAHGSWMVKITLKDQNELTSLLSAADYEKFVSEEGGH